MSQNRIESLIEELYEYIESCKAYRFSNSQVIVSREEIFDILDEMKLRIPDEIRQCAKVIQNKNQILAAAEERKEKIIEDARRQAEMMVQDDEIVRQAFLKAQDMVSRSSAQADQLYRESNEAAEQITMSALDYTNKMLAAVENVIAQTYEETKARTEAMLQTLEGNLRIIQENRRELTEDVVPQEEEVAVRETVASTESSYSDDEDELYHLDADAFLDNIE